MKQWPKTREGLVDLIIEQLGKAETTYVSFCKEMESAQNDGSPEADRLFHSFCEKSCEIHRRHVSHQLFCLPFSCLELIRKNQGSPREDGMMSAIHEELPSDNNYEIKRQHPERFQPLKVRKMAKKCPRCHYYSMYPAGEIRAGPRKGLRKVYVCRRCGYRAIH